MIGSFEIEIRNTFTPSVESMGMVFVQTLGTIVIRSKMFQIINISGGI